MNRPRQLAAAVLALFVLAAGCHYRVIVHDRIDRQAAVDVARRVSRIRHLRFVDRVHLALVDRQQVVRQASRDSSARSRSARARGERRLYEMLGLIAAGDDPQAARQKIVTARPAGLYLPLEKRLQMVAGRMVRSEAIEIADLILGRDLTGGEVLGHELVHALQSQHFGLDPPPAARHNQDARLAHMALVEGDASLIGFQLGVGGLFTDPAGFIDFIRGHAADLAPGAPAFIQERFKFPYLDGAAFVLRLRAAGGLDAVDRAFARPPLSSEEVLHPEKYLGGFDPPRLPQADDLPPPDPGYRLVFTDTLGEFGIRAVLQQALDRGKAAEAAAGWGGDRAMLFGAAGGSDFGLMWIVDWDTEADAGEFFDGFDAVVSRWAGGPGQAAAGENSWFSGGRRRHLEIFGRRVIYSDCQAGGDAYLLEQAALRVESGPPVEPGLREKKLPPARDPDQLIVVDAPPARKQAGRRGPLLRIGAPGRSLSLGAMLQVAGRRGERNGISIGRMRVRATGEASAMLDLKLQLEAELSGEDKLLQDAAISFAPVSPELLYLGRLWIGRFRVPYSRSVLTDPERLPLFNRPLAVAQFAPLRRSGLMYDFDAARYGLPVRVRAGAFDGFPEGRGRGPLAVVRLDCDPARWLDDSLVLKLGAAYLHDGRHADEQSGIARDREGVTLELSAGFGGYRLDGTYFWADDLEGGGFESSGWVLTARAFLLSDFLQLVGRYEESNRPGQPTLRGAGAGVNLFYLSDRFVMSYNFEWRAQGDQSSINHLLIFQLVI